MKSLMGFVLTCVLIPGVYAGLAYWYLTEFGGDRPENDPLTLAILLAFPLAVSGVPKWWDVWRAPLPKLGAPGGASSPSQFLTHEFRWHVIAIIACVVVHLTINQKLTDRVSGTRLTLDAPEAKARLAQIETELADAGRMQEAAERNQNAPGSGGLFEDDERIEASRMIRQLINERESLSAQLAEHEENVALLDIKAETPGDLFSPYALGLLWASALGSSLVSPVKKRYRSGQPIRQG